MQKGQVEPTRHRGFDDLYATRQLPDNYPTTGKPSTHQQLGSQNSSLYTPPDAQPTGSSTESTTSTRVPTPSRSRVHQHKQFRSLRNPRNMILPQRRQQHAIHEIVQRYKVPSESLGFQNIFQRQGYASHRPPNSKDAVNSVVNSDTSMGSLAVINVAATSVS